MSMSAFRSQCIALQLHCLGVVSGRITSLVMQHLVTDTIM
jgi:hypothetical protein